MLKKVPTDKALVGMYVHEIACSWWEHPFWRNRIVLQSDEQLRSLRESGAEYIIIDDEKGIGVERAPQEQDLPANLPALEPVRHRARGTAPAARDFIPARIARSSLSPSQWRAEVTKARGTLNRSKLAVQKMFEDARMGKAIQIQKMVSVVNQLTASVDKDPAIILNMARLKTKDDYTYMHSVSVSALMINLARKMRLDEILVREAGMAGLLHDVGKLVIPNDILLKPERLSDEEFEIVRDHPLAGYKILAASKGVSAAALDVCLHHHEKMDGSGYPDKLNGEELQLLTRMAAICDVYDAVTSQRSYNNPWSASEALARMQSWRGHFDQMILRSFVESLSILPVGTLVRLTNDHLAIVAGETEAEYFSPQLRMFYSIQRRCEVPVHDLEISHSAQCWQISSIEEPYDWGFGDWPAMQARLLSAKGAPSQRTGIAPRCQVSIDTEAEAETELAMRV